MYSILLTVLSKTRGRKSIVNTLVLCALGSGIWSEMRTMCSLQMCSLALRQENALTVFRTAVLEVRSNTAAVSSGSYTLSHLSLSVSCSHLSVFLLLRVSVTTCDMEVPIRIVLLKVHWDHTQHTLSCCTQSGFPSKH